MTLSPGTRLGPYEISSLVGVGGMGEVYRATDANLGRHVAIKVLPETVAHDPERLARFDREARTLAVLNHANIATVHGLEKTDGVTALVMEFVDGPTLADRIAHRPLPVMDALRIAKQIANALEAAHAKGVVHRDLKPANVKVRPDGTVKVLDFGLAKAYVPVAHTEHTHSPTLTSPAQTLAGVILGTAAYMSPEQAAGGDVDQRSDIWSFGVVLYEMLTGRRLFDGDSVPRVIARVLERDIDLSALPVATPPSIRHVLRRCLERDRERRLHHIADARLEIEDVLSGTLSAEVTGRSGAAGFKRPLMWVSGAVIMSLALLAAWAMRSAASGESPRVVFRSSVDTPSALPTVTSNQRDVAISPDGTRLAFSGSSGRLYVRAVDKIDFTEVPGVAGAYDPAFSPDSRSIAFFDVTTNSLKRVSVLGGAPTEISGINGAETRGIAWGPDDTLYFSTNSSGGLFRVPVRGGKPERLTTVDDTQGELSHAWPTVLPNGKGVLFTACGSGRQSCRLALVSVATGAVTRLNAGSDAHYAQPGYIIYADDRGLRALGFDQDRLTITAAESTAVTDSVLTKTNGAADFDVAANGTLVYVPRSASAPQRTLVWVDRTGNEQPLGLDARGYGFVRVSPDGRRVAASADGGIWVSEIDRPALTLVTGDMKGATNFPFWTPDGQRLVFAANALTELFWTAADGTTASAPLFSIKGNVFISPEGWADGGRTLVFTYGTVAEPRIGKLSMNDKSWRPLVDRVYDASMLSVHPDGKWLVYQSDSSGKYEIYIERFPELGDRRTISTLDGGWAPVWAPDGRRVFYRRGSDGAMMAARIQTTPTLKIDPAVKLFDSREYEPLVPPPAGRPAGRTYDIAPDGRFLMIKEPAGSRTNTMILVQNFVEEFRPDASRH